MKDTGATPAANPTTPVLMNHFSSDMALLGGVLGRERLTAESALETVVGTFLRRGSLFAFFLWIVLNALMIAAAPLSSYQFLTVQEQMANIGLLILLVGVNMNRWGPLLVNDARYDWNFLLSGPMIASLTVQFIAISSLIMMILLPTPILIDPIVGMRVHLVRWVEWTPLAFLMSFLTESIDLPLEHPEDNTHRGRSPTAVGWFTGIMMALSTACGIILPCCPNLQTWLVVLATSCMLFSWLFIRLAQKAWRVRQLSRKVCHTAMDKEDYERSRFAVKLMAICAGVWTTLVLSWMACAFGTKFYGGDESSVWSNDWIVLAVENTCEALSKIGYLSVLMEVHEQLFDEVSRGTRRLDDLKTYMSAVWDVSDDVMVICSNNGQASMVNAAVSPAFFQMEHGFDWKFGASQGPSRTKKRRKTKKAPLQDYDKSSTTLVMEVDPYIGSYRTFEVDLSRKMSREEASDLLKENRSKARVVTPIFNKNLKVLSDLVCDACTMAIPYGRNQNILMKDFYCSDPSAPRRMQKVPARCKVVNLKDEAFLIVVTAISPSNSNQRILDLHGSKTETPEPEDEDGRFSVSHDASTSESVESAESSSTVMSGNVSLQGKRSGFRDTTRLRNLFDDDDDDQQQQQQQQRQQQNHQGEGLDSSSFIPKRSGRRDSTTLSSRMKSLYSSSDEESLEKDSSKESSSDQACKDSKESSEVTSSDQACIGSKETSSEQTSGSDLVCAVHVVEGHPMNAQHWQDRLLKREHNEHREHGGSQQDSSTPTVESYD
eukprot:CAMPEP_0168734236 /NCGR_PEP_ID=MMETSP0724-20121128/8706_1 /TAXON_ID=265536 /ORGANISM="Amphiprora sp., Strain CCMP467" /LENGTH=772 /DNA_ID=CAMNT_0008781327 /DNA_START=78 /DNA_END=2394 /DNA_ORIENTATION=-